MYVSIYLSIYADSNIFLQRHLQTYLNKGLYSNRRYIPKNNSYTL